MINEILISGIIKMLLVLILFTTALIIAIRSLSFLNFLYRIQSFLIVLVAVALYYTDKNPSLLAMAAITLVSKVIIIPMIVKSVQTRLKIKRDVEFHYLTPLSAILVSALVFLIAYMTIGNILSEFKNTQLAVTGSLSVSLMFMGLMVIFTRQQTITNTIGYLTMENGVLLFSLFMAELPLVIEVIILLDLIILTVLAALLAFGIDSNIEEFHSKLRPIAEFLGGKK